MIARRRARRRLLSVGWLRRRVWRVAGVAAVLLFAVIAAVQVRADPPTSALRRSDGETALPFDLSSVVESARAVRLPDADGRPVVLNFFASWCVPCREEMPVFQSLFEQLGDQVAFIGIDLLEC